MGHSGGIQFGMKEASPRVRASRRARGVKTAGWHLWLLVAGWCFANCSQQVSVEFIIWVGHGRHFSHQEQLKADVAALLRGRKVDPTVTSSKSEPVRPPAAPASAESSSKKVDLFASRTVEPSAPSVQRLIQLGTSIQVPDRVAPEPLLTPPRTSAVS
jgi:hypothetical protein